MKGKYTHLLKVFLVASTMVLVAHTSGAQESELTRIKQNFNHFSNQQYKEKIYLHTDRSFYVVGEILWYSLYLVDGKSNRSSDLSKVGYIEILDKGNVAVSQQSIKIADGGGNGSIYLPVSLSSGNYKIRAYTNWMKNFGAETFFEQTFSVLNPFESSGIGEPAALHAYDIQFLPEGGTIVKDLPCTIGVKVTDRNGMGREFKGIILGSKGDTLVKFNSFKFGMGSFSFVPTSGNKNYKALINIDGSVYDRTLPEIVNTGVSIGLTEIGNGKVKLSVLSNLDHLPYLSLLVHSREVLMVAELLRFENGKAEVVLEKDRLGEGISCFTLFDDKNNAVAERLYFRRPKNILKISASMPKPTLNMRASTSVDIRATCGIDTSVQAKISLAIYKVDSLGKINQPDILSYLWLNSDLKGFVESSSYYFESENEEIAKAANNLMLTQGWRKFNWKNIFDAKEPEFNFLPEYEGQIINAHLKNRDSLKVLESATAYLSWPGKNFSMSNAEIKSNGEVRFVTKDFYGPSELVLQINSNQHNSNNLELASPYLNSFSVTPVPVFGVAKAQEKDLIDRSVSAQVQNVYEKDHLNRFRKIYHDVIPFYGQAYKTYRLDDFTRFPTIAEVMTEYVPEVAVRKIQGNYVFKMLISHEEGFFENEPLILLNGIPMKSADKIVSIDPLKIERLEIVNKKFVIGKKSFPGIVSFTGYDSDNSWLELGTDVLKVKYEGLQPERIFYSPAYEASTQTESELPDFRTLLFWAPNIQTKNGKAMINFCSSDLQGKYVGILQGMTRTGEMGSGAFMFEVK